MPEFNRDITSHSNFVILRHHINAISFTFSLYFYYLLRLKSIPLSYPYLQDPALIDQSSSKESPYAALVRLLFFWKKINHLQKKLNKKMNKRDKIIFLNKFIYQLNKANVSNQIIFTALKYVNHDNNMVFGDTIYMRKYLKEREN